MTAGDDTPTGPSHIFGAAAREHWPVLLKAAQVLIEHGLPPNHPWQARALEDLEALMPDTEPSEAVTIAALDAVLATFGKEHPIGKSPFAAFLATRMQDKGRRASGNRLSAWILAAALCRHRLTPKQNAIEEGLNKARSLKSKAPEALDGVEHALETPETLLDALDKARKHYDEATVRKYFAGLAALMRSAIKLGPATHRQRDSAEDDAPEPLPMAEVTDEAGLVRITGGVTPEAPTFAGPTDLQEADRVPTRQTVRGPDDAGDFSPAGPARIRTRKAARAAARRDLSLAAEHDPLTACEVATLVAWLKDNREEPGHAELMADLVFGVAHTRDAVAWDAIDGQLGLILHVTLPDFETLVETPTRFTEDEHLFLPTPPTASVPAPEHIARQVTAQTFKTLRHRLARPLTRGRVHRYKADWLRRAGADEAVIGFLTAVSPGNRAQMHYSCVEKADLVGWHARYLEEGLGLPAKDPTRPTGAYGSRLRIPHEFLAAIFADARKDVAAKRPPGPGSTRQVRDAHNAFALYTLMVLYLATGHRPVSHPFEFRSDFDLEAGLLWLSDKDGRGARGTRMLPLAPRAVAQAEAWITHLERLARRLYLTDSNQTAQVRAALLTEDTGRGPFFLIFDEAGKLAPLRPALQETAFASVLPTALNWTRHILRSALMDTGRPAALDAFLGHGHMGEEPFVAGSSLGLSDLWPVADAIEALFDSMKIKIVESPL